MTEEEKTIELIRKVFKDKNCLPLKMKEICISKRFNKEFRDKFKNKESFKGTIRNYIYKNWKYGERYNEKKEDIFKRGENKTWELKDKNICNWNIDQKDQKEIEKIIDDIDDNIDQDQKWSIVNYKIFKRNKNLIYEIRKRANKKCEYCNKSTFINKNNENYLEVHHINFLCEGGKDELNNLIALCPNCHRKAHFSKEKREFQQELRNIVNKYNSKNHYTFLLNNL